MQWGCTNTLACTAESTFIFTVPAMKSPLWGCPEQAQLSFLSSWVIESQKNSVWKRPLKVIYPNPHCPTVPPCTSGLRLPLTPDMFVPGSLKFCKFFTAVGPQVGCLMIYLMQGTCILSVFIHLHSKIHELQWFSYKRESSCAV